MKYRPPRPPSRIPGTVIWRGASHRCTITSINDGGAGLIIDQPIKVGETIVIEGRHRPLRATVKWADDGKIGAAFEKILTPRNKDQFCMTGHNRPAKPQFGMQFRELR